MAQFILQEHASDKYSPRTKLNAKSAHLTLALAVDLTTSGEVLTHKFAGENYLGFQLDDHTDPIQIARVLYSDMKRRNAKTLNVAGNGIYTFSLHGWTQARVNTLVTQIVGQVHKHWPIEMLFSGGQTGADIAAAAAAKHLDIPAIITLPRGFKQRYHNGSDVTQTKDQLMERIDDYVMELQKQNFHFA